MTNLEALDKKSFAKALKKRMEEFRDGVILKLHKKVENNFKIAVKDNMGVVSDKTMEELNKGILDFDKITRVKKKGNGKWLLKAPNGEYPCEKGETGMKIYYEGDIESLDDINKQEIKMILMAEAIRKDEAMIYNNRRGTIFFTDPTKKAIKKYGGKRKAEHKLDKRINKYKDRLDRWWKKIEDKAKEEQDGIL